MSPCVMLVGCKRSCVLSISGGVSGHFSMKPNTLKELDIIKPKAIQ